MIFFNHSKLRRLADLEAMEECVLIGCENPREGGFCLEHKKAFGGELQEAAETLRSLLINYQAKRSRITDEKIYTIYSESVRTNGN